MTDHQDCKCWRCFFQSPAGGLFVVLILSLILTVAVMHEHSLNDKFVSWAQNITLTVLNLWALALKVGDRPPAPPHPPQPPAAPVPAAPAAPQPQQEAK